MENLDEDTTPFWLQTADSRRSSGRRRRNQQPSSYFLFNTGILIIILLIIAFAFIFIIIPSFLSFTSKIFKPQLVKKSWDSLNIVLVLFAIICGFLSKSNSNNDNGTPRSSFEDYKFSTTPKHVRDNVRTSSNPSTPRQWYNYSSSSLDRTAYNSLQRLRSSSSYPDLRQESTPWMMNGDDRWRFYDDTNLYHYRTRSNRQYEHQEDVYGNDTKDIAVDTVQASPMPSPPPPASPPPAIVTRTDSPPPPPQSPPPQPPKVVRRKPKRSYEDVKPEVSERKDVIYSEMKHSLSPAAAASSSTPSARPPSPPSGSENRSKKSEKKRGGITKDFLISLRRKKKQRQRSVENLEEFFNLSTLPLYPPPSPPPPPPPPPPLPSFYQTVFSSKKSKTRKHHSVPSPPSAPPPTSLEAHASKREPQKPPVTTQKPHLPVKIRNINNVEESVESGNESPLNPIPPPPPPPPFKMAPWKFEVDGDFVRLKSIRSSRSGSPDLDADGEASPSGGNKKGETEAGESRAAAGGPLFCPSPDVNTKADDFIARFRAGLNLEKINSVKRKSNLGPDPSPSTI